MNWRYFFNGQQINWVHYELHGIWGSEDINRKWNEQHVAAWKDHRASDFHSRSPISHYASNSALDLAVTVDGELIFGRKDDTVLVITCSADLSFRLVVYRYRMLYDVYLLFLRNGYTVKKYKADSCPASTTIPQSGATGKAYRLDPGDLYSDDEMEEEENEEVLNSWPKSRAKLFSEKPHKLKSRDVRGHPLQYRKVLRLERKRTYNALHRKQERAVRNQRKDKQYHQHIIDNPMSPWLDPCWAWLWDWDDRYSWCDCRNDYMNWLGDVADDQPVGAWAEQGWVNGGWAIPQDDWEITALDAVAPLPVPEGGDEDMPMFALFGW